MRTMPPVVPRPQPPSRLTDIPGVSLRRSPLADAALVDVFPLRDGRWGVTVARASPDAVPVVRHTVRAAARMWSSPAEIVRFTNTAVVDEGAACRLVFAVVRRRGDDVSVTVAVGSDDTLERGIALGGEARVEARDVTVDLGVGETIALGGEGGLVAEVTGVDDAGDVVTEPGGPFDERYPAITASVTESRRAVAGWLGARAIDGPRVPDLLLAVSELVANAVAVANEVVDVRAWLTEDAVMAEVTDDGPGFDGTLPAGRTIDPMVTRGRGLFLVANLVDECTILSGTRGTTVRCLVAR